MSVTNLQPRPPEAEPTLPASRRTVAIRWLVAVNALNIAVIGALFVQHGGVGSFADPGGVLTGIGRLAGLYGAYCSLAELVLMSRLPWLDRALGMDRLARWHRLNGHAALYLMLAHVVLITLGYAAADQAGIVHEFLDLLLNYRDVMMSTVALALFIAIVVVSIKIARRKLRYETWHFVHLYAYLAIALALPHQLVLGDDFVKHTFTQIYWWVLFAIAVGSIVVFRFGVPIRMNLWHRFRVANVVQEAHGVVSIYVTGRHLERVPVASGQFFLWRFLTKDMWWQAHPYSLSAAPNGKFLRITVKNLGDHSNALASLVPGTRVFAEGPYGAFTAAMRRRQKVLLVGGGVGVTPVRALFESIPGQASDVTLVYRVTKPQDALFLKELKVLADARNATLHVVGGERAQYPLGAQPLSAPHLAALVPDIRSREAYVCGPEGMIQTTVAGLVRLGVHRQYIHYELFEF